MYAFDRELTGCACSKSELFCLFYALAEYSVPAMQVFRLVSICAGNDSMSYQAVYFHGIFTFDDPAQVTGIELPSLDHSLE